MRGMVIGLAVAAFVAAALACSEDAGTTSTGGGGSGGDGGSGGEVTLYGDSECGTCVVAACAAVLETCNADPGCAAHFECVQACPLGEDGDADAACEAACEIADSSTTRDEVNKVKFCRDRGEAVGACEACGKIQQVHECLDQTCEPSVETNVCWVCEDESCCDTQWACRDDTACSELLACLQGCLNGDECINDCYAMRPEGAVLLETRLACIEVLCLEECALPNPCNQCTSSSCANERMECAKDFDCTMTRQCTGHCLATGVSDVLGCNDMCTAQYPGGVDLWGTLIACQVVQCGSECSMQ